jgi:HAMP domain-containing protein
MKVFNPTHWPITIKLSVALLGAALLPAIFIALFNLNEGQATVENTEYDNLKLLADATAKRMDQLMLDNVIAAKQVASDAEVIRLLSNTTEPSPRLVSSITESFERILVSNEQYEYVYLLDRNGLAVISIQLEGLSSIQGGNFADRAYFYETMKGEPFIDVLVGRVSRKMGFYFAAPVRGEQGELIGAAVIKLQGEAITDIVNTFEAGQTGYAFLVDQDGVVVAHPRYPEWYYQSFVPLDNEIALRVGRRFVLDGCSASDQPEDCKVGNLNLPELHAKIAQGGGTRQAAYTSPVDNTEKIVGIADTSQYLIWTVVVNKDKDEFTAPIENLARQTLLSFAVIVPLVVFGGILLARVITQPIGKLATAAQTIEKGEAFEPERIANVMNQGDEVGNLARVFNAMVQALNARVSELRTVNEVSRRISASVDVADTLTLVLKSVRNVVPYDRAQVLLFDPKRNGFYKRATSDGKAFDVLTGSDLPIVRKGQSTSIDPSLTQSGRDTGIGLLVSDLKALLAEKEQEASKVDIGEWGDFTPRSYLSVPLRARDKNIGMIELAGTKANNFSNDHERVLELIAAQAAIAVQNALEVEQREAELRKQIDELQIVIDETKKQKHVSEIVESDFFQSLTEKAKHIREQRSKRS